MTRRHGLLIALSFSAGIVALRWGVPGMRHWYASERAAARELASNAAEARNAVAQMRVVGDSLLARQRTLTALKPRLFTGASINSAASSAGAYLSALTRTAQVELGTLQITADTGRSALRRVTLTASGRADVHGLTRLLAALEGRGKLMRVASISVNQPDVTGRPDSPEVLSFQLTVHALARLGTVQ